ncbi:MAG: Na/Pi cotransporter family protein [Deltaproteobacteria bacterium]|nr:Na/Pi cotransporter family protein [Deltaproteobacteria bacterium]
MDKVFFYAIGGLGMFLYGMKLMSTGLQKVAGDRLRNFLEVVSSNRVVGALVGMSVTALVQSSSLTTVTLVGFVNAGLMNLTQAVGVILGANVGTTVTAQIIAFKVTNMALVAIFLGMVAKLFAPRRKWTWWGEVVLGFGLLFYGMTTMSSGFAPLRTHPEFIKFFTAFDASNLGGVILCVATGTVLTMILQSSSATVGITIAMASQGLLNLPGSVALILGDNIGTTITAELASIGGNLTARRAARAHTMFNVLGVCYIVVLFDPFLHLISWVTGLLGVGPAETLVGGEKPNIARYIANAHTVFNVINAVVFLFALPLLTKAAVRFTLGKEKERGLENLGAPQFLDYKFVDNPSVALAQAVDEVVHMGEIVQAMYQEVTEVMFSRKREALSRWKQSEDALDRLQKEITEFLVQVSQGAISDQESHELAALMRMANNVERVGDSVENLAEALEEMLETGTWPTEAGVGDYRQIRDQVSHFLELTVRGIRERDKGIAPMAKQMEDSIDDMRETMRDNHVQRLGAGICAVDAGLLFVDLLNNFEKIGDYCYNIARALRGPKR